VVQEDIGQGLLRITGLVEKPKPQDAPSAFAAIGGYVVTADVIAELQAQTDRWYEHRSGEIYLTDAINAYAADQPAYGQVIQGTWYDTGNPGDYLVAQFASALAHPEYGPLLRRLVNPSEGP
jgi:UTP--glucose-1-phosphate uridylyltransferase